jgi:hypothetical protein
MKITDFVLLVVGGVSLCVAGCSQPMNLETAEPFDAGWIAKRHSFDIGPEVYYYKYDELDPSVVGGLGEVLIKDTGVFYGVAGGYSYRGWAPVTERESLSGLLGLRLRAEGRYAQGQVDYDGSTWGGEPRAISGIGDCIVEGRVLVGPDFAIGNAAGLGFSIENTLSTLYTGFGYRYLNDDMGRFRGGYERESNYYYLPIGLTAVRQAGEEWRLGGTIEFDWLIQGVQKSHLSDTGLLSDVENDQNRGFGLRASVKLQKTGKANLIIEPFVRCWCIAKSQVETTDGIEVLEPKNRTTELGVVLAIGF